MDANYANMDGNASTSTALCVIQADIENINPVQPPCTSLALTLDHSGVVAPEEEAVCAYDWHPGIPENDGDGETDKCPECGLGLLRWFYLDDERMVKLCNNILCNYPFDSDEPIEYKAKPADERDEDSDILSYFEDNEHMTQNRLVLSAEEMTSQAELNRQGAALIAKYVDETDK